MKLDGLFRNVMITAAGVILAGIILSVAGDLPGIKQARDGLR